MTEPTLHDLANRIATLEAVVGIPRPSGKKSWRNAVGAFTESQFHAQVLAESEAIREADREAGRSGEQE